jgi:hypothetical protein
MLKSGKRQNDHAFHRVNNPTFAENPSDSALLWYTIPKLIRLLR